MAVNKKEMAAGLASAVALISGAQVANAADIAAPVGHDWSGVYLGISAGYQFGDMPVSLDNDYNMNGDIAFGGFIGVNHQYDSGLVIGAEIAAQTGNNPDDEDSSYDYKVNYTIDSKLKVGMALGSENQFLAYVFAGPSITQTDVGSGSNTDYTAWSANFGIGAEWMVTEQFSVGAELLGRAPIDEYADWGDDNAGINGQATLRAAFHF